MISWEKQSLSIIWAYLERKRTCLTDSGMCNVLALDYIIERWTLFKLLYFMIR